MSLGDRLKAIAKETRRTAAEQAQQAAEKIKSKDEGRFDQAAALAATAADSATGLAGKAGDARDRLVERGGQTRVGGGLGKAVRTIGGELSKLPLLSLPSDVMTERNGITELTALVAAEPTDPARSLWLGQALRAMERDQKIYFAVRSVVDPTKVVTRQLVGAAAEMGATSRVRVSERMLKRALALAILRLKDDPKDTAALEVAARVYLIRSGADKAMRTAKLAVATAPKGKRGSQLVTLALVYLAAQQIESAVKAADLAVKSGHTMGYQVMADALYQGEQAESTARERHREFVRLAGQVTPDDRVAYLGFLPKTDAVFKAVATSQRDRTLESAARAKQAAGDLSRTVGSAARQRLDALRQRTRPELPAVEGSAADRG
ncbi:hypothetical protein F4553_001348 [Allocatelliglobosispora scoriae]|uniref:Uncharacterized protein n=1 Tax=Allocatelliglobosispora scoriae TaxID=643052 RepID=A0A841BL94_9ACTN|nr:hypothetical protein [Allocatelliglobosispora scoriae]MBB5867969.1 hypothetical protein [Allocatelliglobosispora scoriae]